MTDTPEAVRLADDFQPLRDALEAVPAGWGRLDASWPHQDTDGVAIVGALLDGEQYEVMVIDTGNYDDPFNAIPLARFYAASNPSAIRSLLAERDQLRAELEKVRAPEGWGIYQNCDGSIQAAMPNGDKWHFKQNHRPGETAWFAYRLLSALLPADPTSPYADQKGAA